MELENFKADNIVFGEPKLCKFTGGSYHRIPIQYIDDKGKTDELCIATAQLTSFGIQEVRDYKDKNKEGPIEGYSLPLVIDDEQTHRVIEEISQKCRDHLKCPDVKRALKKWDLSPDAMTPFFRKRDEYGNFEDTPPKIYPKLFTKFNTHPPEISSQFFDCNDDTNPINPSDLINVRCKMVVALIFKDIYVGAKPSMQVKVADAIVYERISNVRRRLVNKFKPSISAVSDCVMNSIEDEQQEPLEEKPADKPAILNKIVRRAV